MKKILLFIVMITFLSGSAYAADVLYVQSVKAKLLSGAQFSSQTVGEVKRGDKLEVIQSEGRWYQVTTGSLTGWVNKLCVADSPPMASPKA